MKISTLLELTKYRKSSRTEEVELDKIVAMARNHCSHYIDANGLVEPKIFRGRKRESGELYLVFDSSKMTEPRKSAYTDNFYTMMMDNLSSWSKFPKRSKSLVCTTSIDTAENYGNGVAYIVIPFDNTPIGICPSDDLWSSFNYLTRLLYISSMGGFGANVAKLFAEFGYGDDDFDDEEIFKSALINVEHDINNLSEPKLKNRIKKLGMFDDGLLIYMLNKKLKTGKLDIIAEFNDLLSPKLNDFKLVSSNRRIDFDRNEVWLSGRAIMIRFGAYGEFVKRYMSGD